MFRFASLGSGSRGNATLVQGGDTLLLVDNGFAVRELVRRCELLDVDPAAIDAVLVTHEHGDHMKGVGALSRRFGMPVWMTHGTRHAADFGKLADVRLFGCHDPQFAIGDLQVQPVAVPHDAREPVQFVFSHTDLRLGILTDLGSLTPHVNQHYAELDALLLEANHDPDLLANGPYPPSLQARVGGNYGHLSNDQAADFLASVNLPRLRHLVVAHMSEKNNQASRVRESLYAVHPCVEERFSLLSQDQHSAWFEVKTASA